jgi:hypothetical protein
MTSTERLLGPSASFQQVSAALTGLSPATTYCYRIFALNPAGNKEGAIRTFKTPG